MILTIHSCAVLTEKQSQLTLLGEVLSYIAKLYDFEPKIIYSELHYAKVLENELNITIEIKD